MDKTKPSTRTRAYPNQLNFINSVLPIIKKDVKIYLSSNILKRFRLDIDIW